MTMIVDLHTQVWADPEQLGRDTASRLRQRSAADGAEPIDGSPASHEKAMECVDGAVVLGYRADRLGARIPNEYIAEFVGKDPSRRVGVAGIDPTTTDAMDQIDAAAALGLAGINLSPACQGFHPTSTAAMRVYERAADMGMPVFVTMQEPLVAEAELEFARPSGFDEVARTFPQLAIVIGHLGRPFIHETLLLIGKHERVFADISGVASRRWQLYQALLDAAAAGVMQKLLFGSGFPHDSPARAIENLYKVNSFSQGTPLPSVPRESIRAIIERNPLAGIGIEAEIAARPRDAEPDQASAVPVVEVPGGSMLAEPQ